MQTHYEVLGVHSHSEPASIRTAYMTLMKRHHPDRRVRGRRADVYRINLAYAVLRDPARRAQYDAELLHMRMQSLPFPGKDRRLPVVTSPHKRRSAAAMLLLWLLALPLLMLATSDKSPMTPVLPSAPAVAQMLGRSPSRPTSPAQTHVDLPNVDQSAVKREVIEAAYLSLDRAVLLSVRCFAQVRSKPQVAVADRCIALDLAYSYWHEGEFSGKDMETYFSPSLMRQRHEAALALVAPQDLGARLEALRAGTFAALTDSLHAGVDASPLHQAKAR